MRVCGGAFAPFAPFEGEKHVEDGVHVPQTEEEDDEGDVAMRHRVPAREVVLEVVGEANERPVDAARKWRGAEISVSSSCGVRERDGASLLCHLRGQRGCLSYVR